MRKLLFALVYAAALGMAVSSCEKDPASETPKNTTIGIDIPEENFIHVYKNEPNEFRFNVNKNCLPASARVTLADGLQAKVIVNSAGEGTLTLTTTDGGRAQVNVYSRTNGCIFNVTAEIHNIDIDTEDGYELAPDGTTVTYGISTTIPEDERGRIEVVSDASWLEASTNGRTVTLRVPLNDEYKVRTANVTLRTKDGSTEGKPVVFTQGWEDDTPEGCVAFRDRPFKNGCLKAADTDGDGQVSFSEALEIRRLDVRGLGIENLTGIERFQNLEEIDFRDNKVEHADVLTQLPQLHSLDMEGNPLKSFDVHGCQQVFSLCRFDTKMLNDNFYPQYKVRYEQVNVSAECDAERRGSTTVDFTKPQSSTAEMDYGVHLMKEHTVGPGYPLVLMGIGLTDTEIEDGNYRRLMEVLFNRVTKGIENLPASEFREYFDIFYINFISPERDCTADIEWMNGMQTHIKEYEKSLSNYYGKDYMRQLSWKVFYYAHVIGYCHKSIGGKAGIGSDIFNGKSFDVGCGMYTGFMVNGKPSEQLGGANGIDLICKEYWKIDQ